MQRFHSKLSKHDREERKEKRTERSRKVFAKIDTDLRELKSLVGRRWTDGDEERIQQEIDNATESMERMIKRHTKEKHGE